MAPQPRVFFDFAVGGEPLGRVVFELFSNAVPKTAENFRALCTGEKGVSPVSHLALHYKNTPVHRIIDGFMIQGGDFTKKNGSGGESIYGGQFPDERLSGDGTDVDREGLLVMANRGPDTNGSQWFITLAPAPHLTGKHVVFGRVIHGLEHVLAIGKLPTDGRDRPISPVTIPHCGELELRKPPPKKRSPSPSPVRSEKRSLSPRRDKRRGSDDESDDSYQRRKEKKARRKEKESRSKKDKKPKEETLDELDARLEREEKQRLEAERLQRVEEQKREIERERIRAKESGDVVYKGRGAMRYLDPESLRAKRIPQNYDARQPDARPRRGRFGERGERGERGDGARGAGRGERMETGDKAHGPDTDEKWARGQPISKDSLDRDLERYRPKAKTTTVDYDDWRVGRDRAYGERFTAGADAAANGAVDNGAKSGDAVGVSTDRVRSRSQSRSRSVRMRTDSRSRSRSARSPSPIRRRPPSPTGDRGRGRSATASDMEMDPED